MEGFYLFPGTFNPIHNAHLRVAEYALEHENAGKIIFIPSNNPTHKDFDDKFSNHKLNLVKLATKYNPKFKVSDIEYELGGKSYTYRTLCELKKRLKTNNKFKLIIGTDAIRHIQSWYETDKLKDMVEFKVFYRDKNFQENEFDFLKNLGYKFDFMNLDFEDISSEDIRERVKAGKDLKNLVPQEVEEYIRKNDLYKN